jgi:hypothetical protein
LNIGFYERYYFVHYFLVPDFSFLFISFPPLPPFPLLPPSLQNTPSASLCKVRCQSRFGVVECHPKAKLPYQLECCAATHQRSKHEEVWWVNFKVREIESGEREKERRGKRF